MIADHLRTRLHDARSLSAALRNIWTRTIAVHFISQAEEDAHLARLERRAVDLLAKDRPSHRVPAQS